MLQEHFLKLKVTSLPFKKRSGNLKLLAFLRTCSVLPSTWQAFQVTSRNNKLFWLMYIFAMSRLSGPLEITAQHFNKTEVRPPIWSFNNMRFSAVWTTLLFIYSCALDLCRCPSLSFRPPTDVLTFCCRISSYSLEFIGPSTIASQRSLEAAVRLLPNMTLCIKLFCLICSQAIIPLQESSGGLSQTWNRLQSYFHFK